MAKRSDRHAPNVTKRRQLLVRFIRAGKLRTQHDLQRAFAKQGVRVTQSSLSRDITRLGVIKQRGCYALPGGAGTHSLPPVLAVDPAGPNLLVLKTLPGLAASVAVMIDDRRLPHVVGTVAGDDTVFVATAIGTRQERVAQSLRTFFPRQA